jgi:glycosyltransferase involved in cell wall biosynthesis
MDDLQSLDVGLMPLRDTPWTRGKCAFKAIQYMASGIPVVASPVGITCDLIEHGVNGLLARTSEEWFSHLQRLLADEDLCTRLASAGRETVEQSYSLEKWAPRLISIFDRAIGLSPNLDREQIAA